jgi:hypothetical protein
MTARRAGFRGNHGIRRVTRSHRRSRTAMPTTSSACLMVTGLYSVMLGVQPKQVHAWYLAVYVDAVEWVELPSIPGMSQYADGGLIGSKPYIATGKYIQRISPHCKGPCAALGRQRVSVNHLVLGLPNASSIGVGEEPAHGTAAEKLGTPDADERERRERMRGGNPPRRGRGRSAGR